MKNKILILPVLLVVTSLKAMDANADLMSAPRELPTEMVEKIISHCFSEGADQELSFHVKAKSYMKLATIRKNLITPEKIGNWLKKYDSGTKDLALFDLGKNISDVTYQRMRVPALIFVFAGANANAMIDTSYMLTFAIRSSDLVMVKTLLEHDADPDIAEYSYPVFFFSNSIEIANLLIKCGAIVTRTPWHVKVNVLWEVIRPQYSAELLEFYMSHDVDPTQLHPLDNSCLLHGLANTDDIENVENFIKKAKILLAVIPKSFINLRDKRGQRPLDIAEASLEATASEAFKQLIDLLENSVSW